MIKKGMSFCAWNIRVFFAGMLRRAWDPAFHRQMLLVMAVHADVILIPAMCFLAKLRC